MIFQVRGCSGSGKSWVVYELMKGYSFIPVFGNGKIRGYYSSFLNLFIVGKYTSACGGCDTISTQDEACNIIQTAIKRGYNVLFEGLIASHIAERYVKLYNKYPDSYFIFLSTPLVTCKSQVLIRRHKSGNNTDKPLKNLVKNYQSTHKSRANMHNMGVPIDRLPLMSSTAALWFIKNTLLEAKSVNNPQEGTK